YQDDWTPYQNGYWTFVEDSGWTWISYDPWGWLTDHYGIWRHHRLYGWTWLPFEKHEYRPCVATWFYGDGYVGWYPYYTGYRRGYGHGYEHGFDDGFWAGYNASRFYTEGGGYYPGHTVVLNAGFLQVNIFAGRVSLHESWGYFRGSFGSQHYGPL